MGDTQSIISFCTGYGGIELGLKRAGLDVRTVAYVEIEAYTVANLVAKIEKGQMDAAPVWTDLKTFDGRPFRGKVRGIIGGYPCQPFSNAGKRRGTEDPRHLWPYLAEHICTIRPVWCFFENVSGHLNLGFDEVYKSLRGMGYTVEAGLFTAAEVGAPHKRERLFILAYNPSIGRRSQQEDAEVAGCGAELDNPHSSPDGQDAGGHGKTQGIQGKHRQEVCRGQLTGTSEQLADTDSTRPQGHELRGRSDEAGRQEQAGSTAERSQLWPARPGEQQYEWEAPRTIESGLGRAVDGPRKRVDRLRLLGNGVVPAQAAKAFNTLYERLFSQKGGRNG